MKTITTWKQDQEFESEHDGNRIKVDGNKKNGHGPKALLLSGLAACSGIDVVDILNKKRVSFSNLQIEVDAETVEEHPKVFTGITIIYRVKMDAADKDKLEKAIQLSLDKYCGVAAMLKKNSSISYKMDIVSD